MTRLADLLMFVFVFLAASKLDNQIHRWGALAGYALMFGLLGGWLFLQVLASRKPVFRPAAGPQRVIPVVLTLALVIGSYFNAESTSLLVVFIAHAVYVPFFYYYFDRPERLRSFFLAFSAAGLVNAILNLLQFFVPSLITIQSSSMEMSQELRSAGLYINANESGFYLTVSFLAVSWLLKQRVIRQWIGLAMQVVITLGILVTFSRGAFLLLALVMLFAVSAQRKYFVVAFGVLALFMTLYSQEILSFASSIATGYVIKNRLDPSLLLDSLRNDGRVSLTRTVWEALLDQPFAIRGYMSFRGFDGVGPHNQFLMLWGGAGLLASVTYMWSLASAIKQGLISLRSRSGLHLTLCLLVALQAFASHNLLEHNQYVLLLVLAIRGSDIHSHSASSDEGVANA